MQYNFTSENPDTQTNYKNHTRGQRHRDRQSSKHKKQMIIVWRKKAVKNERNEKEKKRKKRKNIIVNLCKNQEIIL